MNKKSAFFVVVKLGSNMVLPIEFNDINVGIAIVYLTVVIE
jgi:hypothetical protein